MQARSHHDFGVNLYGHMTGLLGLGVAARNTLRAMAERDVPRCYIDMDAGTGRSGRDFDLPAEACADVRGTYPVSLFHTNPTDVFSFAIDHPASIWAPDRVRACVPFWELPSLPLGVWRPFLGSCDRVLAPTCFIRDCVAHDCPDTDVVHYPQAVFIPQGVAPARGAWGIPEAAFACLVVMDASSGFERKNPMGAVEAFRRAFPTATRDEAVLVVKMNDASTHSLYAPEIAQFRAMAEGDARVIIIERSVSYAEVLSLNASCDVLLSLHRSEGLGLNLMEAMSLSTVVVATGWSGNMDFTTEDNAVLVPFTRTPVVSKHPAYSTRLIGEDQRWAEPDVDAAAVALRALHEDPERMARLKARAAEDMELARTRFLATTAFDELRALHESGVLDTAEHAARSAAFRRALRVPLARRVRRLAGNAARGLGVR